MKLLITNKKQSIYNYKTVLWSERSLDDEILSIIDYIEEHSFEIKKNFCELIDNFNVFKINKKKVIDHLNIDESYSAFWCSDFYEKSFYKNPEIKNQIKLIALKKLIIDSKIDEVLLDINSSIDSKSIKILCNSLKVKLINNNKLFYLDFNFKYLILPFITSIKFIKFIYFRLSFKKIDWKKVKNIINKKIFFSYSIYSDNKLLKKGIQNSLYWDPLIKQKLLSNTLWVNIYFHTKKSSLRKELKYYNEVNKIKNQHTIFLDELLDFKIFFKTFYYYFKLLINVYFLQSSIKKYIQFKKSCFLKYYYINYFNFSFLDISSLVSIYYYLILVKLKKNINNIDQIFYLFENQGWEKSLNFVFSSEFKVIAVNHACIRNWDTRFVNDKNIKTECTPYYYATNGHDSYKKLIENKFKKKKTIILEALRYYNLIENINKIRHYNLSSILIVSDVHKEGNQSLESILKNISGKRFENYDFLLKEHLLKKTNFKVDIKIIKTKKNLYELKSRSRIAIVSSTTSAAVDLLLMGYQIIIPLNFTSLNFSPLKNYENVTFVSDYSKINMILSQKLDKIKKNSNFKFKNNFFKYSPNLDGWKKILNER